jgi:hypothetical protein
MTEFNKIRENLQEIINENDDYVLKTNEELIDIISEYGMGETEFHTTDIERLIEENNYFKRNFKNKEDILSMINVFEKLLLETKKSMVIIGKDSDKEVAKNFLDSNTLLCESYKSFIEGMKYCINEK